MSDLKTWMRTVADYYGCDDEECRLMWEAAMRDPVEAKRCMYALVEEIEARHSVTADVYLRS